MLADETITCLTFCRLSAKKVLVPGSLKLADLKIVLKAHPDFNDIRDDTILQIKDKDFDEYVDIEDNRILDDKSKIIYPQCMVTQAGNFNDKTCTAVVEPVAPSSGVLTAVTTAITPATGGPVDIRARLVTLTKGNILDPLRHRIIEWLYYDLCTYTM
ncbi:uncharacterized protein ISCGN_009943 [Ixodes scapularis]